MSWKGYCEGDISYKFTNINGPLFPKLKVVKGLFSRNVGYMYQKHTYLMVIFPTRYILSGSKVRDQRTGVGSGQTSCKVVHFATHSHSTPHIFRRTKTRLIQNCMYVLLLIYKYSGR